MFNTKIINSHALINNIKLIKQKNPNSLICAMVKANAYGVGLKEVVKIISPFANFFGVACVMEAKAVRKICKNPILIVGPLEFGKLDNSFSYTCQSLKDINYLISLNLPFKIHLKINSGMNRYGFSSTKEYQMALKKISKSLLFLEGVFTHFATVDQFVEKQFKTFKKFVNITKQFGFNPIVHADNSFVNEKFNHSLDMVRIGYNLYNGAGKFKSVLKIKTKIVKINNVKKGDLVGYDYRFVAKKPVKIAVLPVGYADGFDMKYLGLKLKINNAPCRVLNICMDCFMLDISKTRLKEGDEIEILNEKNNLKKYAKYISSSCYEVGTKFSFMRAKTIII